MARSSAQLRRQDFQSLRSRSSPGGIANYSVDEIEVASVADNSRERPCSRPRTSIGLTTNCVRRAKVSEMRLRITASACGAFIFSLFSLFLSVGSPSSQDKVVSFQKEFEIFWSKAQAQDTDHQLALWDELVEAPHQEFYDFAVWEKHFRTAWPAIKKKTLLDRFKRYSEIYRPTEKLFEGIESAAREQTRRFKKVIPSFEQDFPIFAIVAPEF